MSGLWNTPGELGVSVLLSGMLLKKSVGWRLTQEQTLYGSNLHPTLVPQPQIYCGRYINAHMLQHHEGSGHPLVLSYADLSAWCYHCQAYVHHKVGPGQTL